MSEGKKLGQLALHMAGTAAVIVVAWALMWLAIGPGLD